MWIKALEIKILSKSNLLFASSTILACFFLLFLIIDLYILIFEVIAQIFISTAQYARTTNNETKQ